MSCSLASTSNCELMNECKHLLSTLMSHEYGWVFKDPVDVVRLNIPDYFDIITHPMDLGTVKNSINAGLYSAPLDFASDVRLTFSNALTYNPAGNIVHMMAETLSKFFERKFRAIEKKTRPPIAPSMRMKKSTLSDDVDVFKLEALKQIFTEKDKMLNELCALSEELPRSIQCFLEEHVAEGQTEIDNLEDFSCHALLTLRMLLDDFMLEKQKRIQANAELPDL